jgi:alkanesulfonate monooxygenase SsuD/methylene tetrahydromethanopterin reductase-like flavin-dependent oxidoreductase (luciferase family)
MRIGYFLSSEEFYPRELVRQARMAEDAGFDGLLISDHFRPWNDKQGHSSFVRSTIGALSQATTQIKLTTAVTCPTVRIHPAIIAARIGDGYCTVSPDEQEVKRLRDAADGPRLVAGGMQVCWAENEHQARATACRLWPNEQLPGELAQIPARFEQASELVSEDMVAEAVPCGPDLDLHLQAIKRYEDAGFDELYIQQIGRDHERFFETYASEILPRFHDHSHAAALSTAAA